MKNKIIIILFILTTNYYITQAEENLTDYVEIINENITSSWTNQEIQENSIDNYFVVSRYYSPLPNQKYYLKWNYEDEIILNWKWLRWASWVEVFTWMLAWPKTYNFWTKIMLKWLWIWDIQDRWWAIVSAWNRWYNYDRIDVWMWSWDEWLLRALSWGKRTVKWELLSSDTTPTLDFSHIQINPLAIKYLEKIHQTQNQFITLEKQNNINKSLLILFETYITPDTKDEEKIKNLQTFFKYIWLYNWEINWKYSDIKDILIKYQIKIWIIKNENEDWAWYFWPKTRSIAKEDYLWFLKNIKTQNNNLKNNDQTTQITSTTKTITIREKLKTNISKLISSIKTPNINEKSNDTKNIQIILKAIWYETKKTSIFDETTKNTLISYQLDKKIISSSKDSWAWVFWPKTRTQISKDLEELLINYLKKTNPWLNIWMNY